MNVHLVDESHVAIIEPRPSGVGATVWVGELRTLNDQPIAAWAGHGGPTEQHGQGARPCLPVSVGASEAEVLARLVARARDIRAGVAA